MIEMIATSDEDERIATDLLRTAGFEPHEFVTKYTRPGVSGPKPDTYCEQIWERPDTQILVRRITWGQ